MRTIHRDIASTFIFSNDNFLLLGKNRKGGVYPDYWVVPGGGIKEHETKLDAARREALEEVGIDILGFDIKLLDTVLTGEGEKVLRDTGEKVFVKMTFYSFTVYANKPADKIAVHCDDDLDDAQWHPITSLHTLNLSPPTITTLQNLGYV